MVTFSELLNKLEYDASPHYHSTEGVLEPDTAHLFRAACEAGVKGIYVIEASPAAENRMLAARPVVYVAEAVTVAEAKQIHRSLWNLGYAPFLIVRLPDQIRVYTGFNYEEKNENGLLVQAKHLEDLNDLLKILKADSIDSGRIWDSAYAEKLDPNQRVDKRLLKNLRQLGEALNKKKLPVAIANSLIGKYVYFRYLRDRKILSDEWLKQHGLNNESIFSNNATVSSLRQLVDALDIRFNGKIFPMEFDNVSDLHDEHIGLVADIFGGAQLVKSGSDFERQLHLDFEAYNFKYIPVETLSAIYEQFIIERKIKGAYYTPEILADYLLSEVDSVNPLKSGMKILDPACGSGVFLVLAYRRLIEKEMQRRNGQKLAPEELRDILVESIYGVEREPDACFIAEFSLILTLLHYVNVDPPDLQYFEFQFPELHNRQIFEGDFFDINGEESEGEFWKKQLNFDWIVGNPPWVEIKPENRIREKFAFAWMESNRVERPASGNRVAEAFCWAVADLLNNDGVIGLVLPATSLFNLESSRFRQLFFSKQEVLRITNFANLREVLFDGRPTYPAATIIYRQAKTAQTKPYIVHYGPFSVNQVSRAQTRPWVITINENEIQTISPTDAEKGDALTWKIALWGTYRDKRVLERIKNLFQLTLDELCKKKCWSIAEGSQLRNKNDETEYELEYVEDLEGKKRFNTDKMRLSLSRFSIPFEVLDDIPLDECHIRKRGGRAGLKINKPPHIILSPAWMNFITYSNEYVAVPSRTMAIAATTDTDADYLKALSVYLSSSLVAYYLFFNVPEWGVFRQAKRVTITKVKQIPTPEFTPTQVKLLADLQKELVDYEKQEISTCFKNITAQKTLSYDAFDSGDTYKLSTSDLSKNEMKEAEVFVAKLRKILQDRIDERVFNIFDIPEDIRLTAKEFIQTRLPLDKPNILIDIITLPSEHILTNYACQLRDELDDFTLEKTHHQVTITYSSELVECVVEITSQKSPVPVHVSVGDLTMTKLFAELNNNLREQFSQWVYVKRGLRFFDGPRVYIYKTPRLIDWTQTQAMIDAGDIIGEVVAPS